MNKIITLIIVLFAFAGNDQNANAKNIIDQQYPMGMPGLHLIYSSKSDELPASVVRKIEVRLGAIEENDGVKYQWLHLSAEKENKQNFSVWLLCTNYPSVSMKIEQGNILRYILVANDIQPIEFLNQNQKTAILPATGAWKYLLPRSKKGRDPIQSLEKIVNYLGHEYKLDRQIQSDIPSPPENTTVVSLTPELLIGVPHNTRMKDETRKWDDADYEYIRLTKNNYSEMIEAGINCFRVDTEQVTWIGTEDVYYWGIGGEDISFPEDLYRSNYIGPVIFFDEPMVGARDYVIRPRLREDPKFRKSITPQIAFEEFKKVYHKKKYEEGPTRLLQGLAERKDVDIGNMNFLQQNIYSWETMISSAYYQLSEGGGAPPYAMVFEPPGRFGARRVLPELNMSFDCQIPVDDPKNLTGIIYGFLRGAARATGKEWGMSVYGQVDRSDAYWFMTHAYDLGGSLFFFWDTHRLAAVPYGEYLALSRNLREHAKNFPNRNLEKLSQAAEVAIVLPAYYNLGHVKMGIGNITGLPELNLERKNSYGVTYRAVMNNFFVEIERCIRLGVAYDLFWNLDDLKLKGYREVVNIREDGKVEIIYYGLSELLNSARIPERPEGDPPKLHVVIERKSENVPFLFTARANVTEGSAPVYYTQGADSTGIHNNQYVLWELYGPEEEDYTDLWSDRWNVSIVEKNRSATIEIDFKIEKPGNYRLRVSTADVAGRSTVVWKDIIVEE